MPMVIIPIDRYAGLSQSGVHCMWQENIHLSLPQGSAMEVCFPVIICYRLCSCAGMGISMSRDCTLLVCERRTPQGNQSVICARAALTRASIKCPVDLCHATHAARQGQVQRLAGVLAPFHGADGHGATRSCHDARGAICCAGVHGLAHVHKTVCVRLPG